MIFSAKNMSWRALVALLIFACASAVALRLSYFGTERLLTEDTAWKISMVSVIAAVKNKTIVSSPNPLSGQYYKLISQRYYHPDFRLLAAKSKKTRSLQARAIESGDTKFTVEYHLQLSQTPLRQLKKKAKLSTSLRAKYLKSNKQYNLTLAGLAFISDKLNSNVHNKQQLLHNIFREARNLLLQRKRQYDDLKNVIHTGKATTLGRARFMVALSRLNGIPARVVTGFVLDEAYANKKQYWVEVYSEQERWQQYDPERGYEITLPNNYIAFDYDTSELLSVEAGHLKSVKYSLKQTPEILAALKLEKSNNILSVLNFYRLDLDTRHALMRLFMLPFCVILVVFFRQLLGIQPYGVFAAPILALAMLHAELVFALLMTIVVIFMSVIGRAFLPREMSRVPRVSIILIFVIMSMALSLSLLSYYSLDTAGNVILLPTIILAFVVDQFYSYMEKTGNKPALIRLGITVVIALLCIPILEFERLREFTIAFPEVHLLSVALVIILSVYKGKKLTDYDYLKFLRPHHDRKITIKNSTKDEPGPK